MRAGLSALVWLPPPVPGSSLFTVAILIHRGTLLCRRMTGRRDVLPQCGVVVGLGAPLLVLASCCTLASSSRTCRTLTDFLGEHFQGLLVASSTLSW